MRTRKYRRLGRSRPSGSSPFRVNWIVISVEEALNDVAVDPAFESSSYLFFELKKLVGVNDSIAEQGWLDSRGKPYPVLPFFRIVAEDINRKLRAAVPEPDKPTPIFLIVLNVLVMIVNDRQQSVSYFVTAPAALIPVYVRVLYRDRLDEDQLVWHEKIYPHAE